MDQNIKTRQMIERLELMKTESGDVTYDEHTKMENDLAVARIRQNRFSPALLDILLEAYEELKFIADGEPEFLDLEYSDGTPYSVEYRTVRATQIKRIRHIISEYEKILSK